MKPLLRWTIGGNCLREGIECLEYAVVKAQQLYPEADHCIAFNNLTKRAEKYIRSIDGVSIVNSHELPCILEPPPDRTEWLIWPPRLRIESQEISMDNDIILTKRHPIVDMFLKSENFFFTTESLNTQHYGNYKDVVPAGGLNVNSGMYGMPAGFDFEKWIINFYIKYGRREYHHANPQGVVAAMIKMQKNYRAISNKQIILAGIMRYVTEWDDLIARDETYGLHFTGLNRGMSIDVWTEFKWKAKDEDLEMLKEKWKNF